MDPVTAVTVAAAALRLVASASVYYSRIHSKIQDAPETIQKQLVHIEQLSGIARLIMQNPALQTLSVEFVLRNCLRQLSSIDDALRGLCAKIDDRTGSRMLKSVLAALKNDKFNKLFEDLEKHKATLILCIQDIDSYVIMLRNPIPHMPF